MQKFSTFTVAATDIVNRSRVNKLYVEHYTSTCKTYLLPCMHICNALNGGVIVIFL